MPLIPPQQQRLKKMAGLDPRMQAMQQVATPQAPVKRSAAPPGAPGAPRFAQPTQMPAAPAAAAAPTTPYTGVQATPVKLQQPQVDEQNRVLQQGTSKPAWMDQQEWDSLDTAKDSQYQAEVAGAQLGYQNTNEDVQLAGTRNWEDYNQALERLGLSGQRAERDFGLAQSGLERQSGYLTEDRDTSLGRLAQQRANFTGDQTMSRSRFMEDSERQREGVEREAPVNRRALAESLNRAGVLTGGRGQEQVTEQNRAFQSALQSIARGETRFTEDQQRALERFGQGETNATADINRGFDRSSASLGDAMTRLANQRKDFGTDQEMSRADLDKSQKRAQEDLGRTLSRAEGQYLREVLGAVSGAVGRKLAKVAQDEYIKALGQGKTPEQAATQATDAATQRPDGSPERPLDPIRGVGTVPTPGGRPGPSQAAGSIGGVANRPTNPNSVLAGNKPYGDPKKGYTNVQETGPNAGLSFKYVTVKGKRYKQYEDGRKVRA